MSICVRNAEPRDAQLLWELIRELADYQGYPDAVQVTADQLEQQLSSARPPFECLVAERGDQLVGMAIFYQNYSTWTGRAGLYLEDLYVRPDERGLNVGKSIMERLVQLANERGCPRIDWHVLKSNSGAGKFYGKLGAAPLEEWTWWRLESMRNSA